MHFWNDGVVKPEVNYFAQSVTRVVSFPYLRFGSSESRLLVYLHGASAKGSDPDLLLAEPLPELLANGLDVPFQVVCPQCPSHLPGWPIEDLLHLFKCLRRYTEKIVVTGVSMGGRGTWELAYAWAQNLAAILPVCGPTLPTLAPRLADLPVWAFHGENDAVVPCSRTEEMINALQRIGKPARFTKLPNQGHSIGREVYSNREIWSWIWQMTEQDESIPKDGLAMAIGTFQGPG